MRFVTQAHFSDEAMPESAMQRLISLAIVHALDGEALESACESLVDTYFWWAQPESQPMVESAGRIVASNPTVTRTEARPIDLSDF